jgi:hypothetical protein
MREPEKIGQTLLPHSRFRLFLKVITLMVLRAYKGAVFCRAIGNFLKRIVCTLPRSDCNCLVREKCLDVSYFKPQPTPDFLAAAKFSLTPPPFVLNPPLTNRQVFHPGETLQFDFVLMDRIIDSLPNFVYIFTKKHSPGVRRRTGKVRA